MKLSTEYEHVKCVVLHWFLVACLTVFPSISHLCFLYTVSSCIIRMITLKIANMAKTCRCWKINVFLIHKFVYLVGCIIWHQWRIQQIRITKLYYISLLTYTLYKNTVLCIHNKVYTRQKILLPYASHQPRKLWGTMQSTSALQAKVIKGLWWWIN